MEGTPQKVLRVDAIVKIYGSEEKFFEGLASMAVVEFPAMKLLLEYAYGKPREQKEEVKEQELEIVGIEQKTKLGVQKREENNDNQ
jgi:hypothetical protein